MEAESSIGDSVGRILDASTTVTLYRHTAESLATSRLSDGAGWFVETTRHAFLYRWLTKDPDPEVIVIDLRETYLVGPVIAVLDRLVEGLTPSWRTSRLKRATDGFVRLVEAGARTKTGRAIASLLEPLEDRE